MLSPDATAWTCVHTTNETALASGLLNREIEELEAAGGAGRSPAAHEREDVASEQHLDLPDPSAVEAPAEGFLERVAVVDAEAQVGAAREASAVLVEAQREELLATARRRAHIIPPDEREPAGRCGIGSSHNSSLICRVDAFFFPRRYFSFLADCQTVFFENEKRCIFS